MNINKVFKKFVNDLNDAQSWDEKEEAMMNAYDALDDYCDNAEKQYIWNKMMLMA